MNNCIIFSIRSNSRLTADLANILRIEKGCLKTHDFPDGEIYVRIDSNVRNKNVMLVCELDHPNSKILLLMFVSQKLKELGAKKICLIAPYLPYLRQDKEFKTGEVVTTIYFANLISEWTNFLITIDPHLHRIKDLSEIYSLDSISILHCDKEIANWIQTNVITPLIIGPDEESEQRVAEVAKICSSPYAIIKKNRLGDNKVDISIPNIKISDQTPVIIDDIISTGTSMIAAINGLVALGFKQPICIGVHGIFAGNAYNDLLNAGANKIITCNTITHSSNKIDITDLIVNEIKRLGFSSL